MIGAAPYVLVSLPHPPRAVAELGALAKSKPAS